MTNESEVTLPRPVPVAERRPRSAKVLLALTAALTALLMALSPTAAFAGWAYGSWSNSTIGGVAYHGRNYVVTNATTADGRAQAGPTGVTVGAGYVGVQGRLYKSGLLVASAVTEYNTQSLTAQSLWNSVSPYSVSTGTFTALGRFGMYSAGFYTWNTPAVSPAQNVPG